MKTSVIIIVLYANIMSLQAQLSDRQVYLNRRIQRYSVMRDIGLGCTVGGACLTAFGVTSVVKAFRIWNEEDRMGVHQDYSSGDTYMMLGFYSIVFGVEALAAGTVLSIIGHKKISRTRKLLNNTSMNFYYTPVGKGFALSYRF